MFSRVKINFILIRLKLTVYLKWLHDYAGRSGAGKWAVGVGVKSESIPAEEEPGGNRANAVWRQEGGCESCWDGVPPGVCSGKTALKEHHFVSQKHPKAAMAQEGAAGWDPGDPSWRYPTPRQGLEND